MALTRPARLLLLASLLLPAGAPAQEAGAEAECPPRGTPSVSVELVDPEARIRPPLPAEELRLRAGGQGKASTHHLGVTETRVDWRTEITVRSLGPREGPVCAVPSELRIRLVHAEHSIRLAREVPQGGCLAREVLAHERRHAEVNRRTLREAAGALRGVARSWAASARQTAPDVNAAAAALQDLLAEAVEPVLERLRAEREAAHAEIDSAEEYRRLGRICPEDHARLRAALGER